jgi:hypothetical protein
VLIAARNYSRQIVINRLLLIVEDLSGICSIIFSFLLEDFSLKNFGVLIIGCLIYFRSACKLIFDARIYDYLFDSHKKEKC